MTSDQYLIHKQDFGHLRFAAIVIGNKDQVNACIGPAAVEVVAIPDSLSAFGAGFKYGCSPDIASTDPAPGGGGAGEK